MVDIKIIALAILRNVTVCHPAPLPRPSPAACLPAAAGCHARRHVGWPVTRRTTKRQARHPTNYRYLLDTGKIVLKWTEPYFFKLTTTTIFPTMTQQFWTEFLELYKENSCLWDIHSSSYLRRDLRNAAYNILLEKYRELDPIATLDMVKRKIDIFRTGFRREQRKVNEQNLLPGVEYKPTLWYFNLLSFLNNYQEFDSTQVISVIKECNENESDDQNGEATIEYVIQKTEEYNLPLCLAFVNYEKAFDSIETWAVLQALQRCQVGYRYIEMLK
ncbi:hypothetical protein MSG28_010169 [Choristoneura fumiferana]|uniref:Uncharacterized protein n=1 Tax=Choristoneura fumiferana TaxID=7141 RepID=A0ACC0KKT4_CHOFU|nr:hypothetical protein MSG28_010169 [Choristoneura fumiferana]